MNDKKRAVRLPVRRCVAMVLLAAPLVAGAQERARELSFSAGYGQTDNILRSPTNEQSEDILELGVNAKLGYESRRIESDLNANLQFLQYQDDTYDDEVAGTAAAALRLNLLPERLVWHLNDSYGQVGIDPFEPVTPDNRQSINRFDTGPQLTLRFGTATSFSVGGRYFQTTYDGPNIDNDGWNGNASLARALSGQSNVSLRYTTQRYSYDAPLVPDLDLQRLSAHYAAEGARTTIDVGVGISQFERGTFDDETPYFSLALTRKLSQRLTLSSNASLTYSTSDDVFVDSLQFFTPGLDPNRLPGTADVLKSSQVGVGLGYEGARTRFGVGVNWGEEEYQTQTAFGAKRTGFTASAARDFTRALTGTLSYRTEDREADLTGQSDRDSRAAAELRMKLGRRFAVAFEYAMLERSSDLPQNDYDENRILLRLVYSPLAQ